MLQEDTEIEFSIANAKIMARERQPIRHDIYLSHLSYYEDCIKTLKSIIDKMSCEKEALSQINYHFIIRK